jgi:hypothetical protein
MKPKHVQVTYQMTYIMTQSEADTQATLSYYYEFQGLDNKLIYLWLKLNLRI